jgi:hypothetical protein
MPEIIMKQKGITLICLQCGFGARILPGEIPVGRCEYCRENFGWGFYPKYLRDRFIEGEQTIFDGDIVIVDQKQPLESYDRIVEIRRNGLVWYSKGMK